MKLKRVAVTGGAGNIAYALLFRIATGELFGKEQPIALHILDIPEMERALEGVRMELEDLASPLLKEIRIGSDPFTLFKDVDLALLVGAKPRGPGMERKDLLTENSKIFVEQGRALDQVASRSVRTLVVGNPCNTNCLIAMQNAPSLPKRHFFAMTRLDQNRASALLAEKANASIGDVKRVAIWGNHSSTQVPDFLNATLRGRPIHEVITDRAWLENDFIKMVQQRGAEIIKARGKSSAASAAQAIIDTVKALYTPTKEGDWFSLAVFSEGNPYGIREDLIFSFPCRSKGNGDWEIVHGAKIDPFLKEKIALTEKELVEEREAVCQTC